MPVNPMPEGYHNVTPVLIVDGAERLIDFLTSVFGAKERLRMPTPDGKIGHSEFEIGDSVVMLADAMEGYPATKSYVHIYVPDVDAAYQRALDAGATTFEAPKDEFYGDRAGHVTDAFGNRWTISTHIEDVSEEEVRKRLAAMGMAPA